MITKKPIHATPTHLQRMLLNLQGYDYSLINKPGKEMVLADRLSQLPSRRENTSIELHKNLQHFTFTPDEINIIRGAVEQHYKHILSYNPEWLAERINKVPRIAQQFWGARYELSIEEGIIKRGQNLHTPEFYDRSQNELHDMHHGIEKMQHRARATMHWPGIDTDRVEYITHWKICTQHKITQCIQSMLSRDVPEAPWQDLTANFFKFNNKEYPLIPDMFSKYPFTKRCQINNRQHSMQVYTAFSQYGTFKCLSTNNEPPLHSIIQSQMGS